jgi:hypothetical protein
MIHELFRAAPVPLALLLIFIFTLLYLRIYRSERTQNDVIPYLPESGFRSIAGFAASAARRSFPAAPATTTIQGVSKEARSPVTGIPWTHVERYWSPAGMGLVRTHPKLADQGPQDQACQPATCHCRSLLSGKNFGRPF